jgi:hypothetical protein
MAIAIFLFLVELGFVVGFGYHWDMAAVIGPGHEAEKMKRWFFLVLFFWIIHTCISLHTYF